MTTRLFPLVLLAGLALVALAEPVSAVTINPVPDILYVVWPLSSTTASLNVTFALQDCSNTATACSTVAVTSGTAPTFTLSLRTAAGGPIHGLVRAMAPCGGVTAPGYWCYNETIQYDNAVNGAYVAYSGLIMWSTGVSPANVWNGQAFTFTAREVRLTSSINDADLPEGRAHANATWESQTHANTTWCATNSCLSSATPYESQSHANNSWESQPHANSTWERQTHANETWESQAHANTTWCPQPACALNGDQLVSRSYADATYEGQPHANQSWVRNSWFNGTFRPNANFGTLTASQLSVGAASAGDMTISGAMTTQTAFDPFVMPIIFGGMTVFSTATSLWIARKPGILGKLAIATLLVVATIWAATTSVSNDANAFRWVAVVITAGWTIIVLWSIKDGR